MSYDGSPHDGGTGAPDEYRGGLRKVSRVVLLDPDERILLLHGHEPDDPSDDWWFTPGGGLEGEETREEAALRELAEETGITEVELGPVLWRRMCSFPFAGRRWDQDEWYYLARTTQTVTVAAGLTELERRSVAGARWWTCQELTEAHETVYPTRLAELLRRLLDEGPRPHPRSSTPKSSRGSRGWRTMGGRTAEGEHAMSAEDLEKYETEMELKLYREYRDVVGLFKYVIETERRFYLTNDYEMQVHSVQGEVFFEVSMADAWVWDMYRPARFVKQVRVLTFKDVNIEELNKSDLELPGG